MRRRRHHPGGPFVGWMLAGGWNNGSARVHALYAHGELRRMGVNSVLLRAPRRSSQPRLEPADIERIAQAGFDVVVFEKLWGETVLRLVRRLREVGTRTVYVTGDLFGAETAEAVDWVVGASEALRAALAGLERSSVIESALDCPADLVKDHAGPARLDRIRVVWVGYPENLHLLAPVREALADTQLSRYELVTISRGPGVTYQWHRTRVFRQILGCDIAVLPSADAEWYASKPNTRLTMLKALGIPSVASPIDSYVTTLAHGRSCYFARSVEEWRAALLALADPAHRRAIGLADRERIVATYGVEAHARRWLALFEHLAHQRAAAPTGSS
jgi:hypothetical protein